jgi:predicted O-methyltransferase YrrM
VPDLADLVLSIQPYEPLFDAEPDEGHALIRSWPVEGGLVRTDPRGFLRPADALTLYDLARYLPGPVLELGSAWGLSTTILCRGVKARGADHVVSMEIDPHHQQATVAAVRKAGLARWHRMRKGEAGALMEAAVAGGETFGAVFIDHDHGRAASDQACRLLPKLLAPGGFALFHDFNDTLNQTGVYGVYDAVRLMLQSDSALAFYGTPGCCALVGWAA